MVCGFSAFFSSPWFQMVCQKQYYPNGTHLHCMLYIHSFYNYGCDVHVWLCFWSISVFPLALFFRLAMLSWLGGKAAGDVSCLTAAKKSESDKKAVALQPHELSSAKRGWHFATIMSFIECLFRLRHGRLWLTTTNLSYSFSLLETSATALCGTTGTVYDCMYSIWSK